MKVSNHPPFLSHYSVCYRLPNYSTERYAQEIQFPTQRSAPKFIAHIRDCDTELSVVAWDRGEVAGVYLCGRRDEVGEISQVAVGAKWRKQGIARSLAIRSLQQLNAAD
jgi:predicted N-acetyltransferase YhbS